MANFIHEIREFFTIAVSLPERWLHESFHFSHASASSVDEHVRFVFRALPGWI